MRALKKTIHLINRCLECFRSVAGLAELKPYVTTLTKFTKIVF
jgi:hypothetical protein